MAAAKKRDIRYAKAPVSKKIKPGGRVVVSEALVKQSATNLAPKIHVKRGDLVMVMSGSVKQGKGKVGKVLRVIPREGKIVVEGVNLRTHFVKARSPMEKSGLVQKEAPIFACKVMLYSQKSKRPVRAEFRKREEID